MTLISFIGDFGFYNQNLKMICNQIEKSSSDYTFLMGDCFYMRGLESHQLKKQLRLFDSFFQNIRNKYMILGNHDHDGDSKDAYKNVSNWIMPNFYYKVEINEDIDIFCIDTCMLGDHAQINWLNKSLFVCKKKYKIVVGHYHIVTNGVYPDLPETQILRPIFEKHGVCLYVCGHEHMLFHKHINFHHCISGASSEFRLQRSGRYPDAFSYHGIGYFRVRHINGILQCEFVDIMGRLLNGFTIG